MTAAFDWTGRVGQTWAEEWQRTDRALADLARHLDAAIEAAAPASPIRILDIGCGAGSTSLAIAKARHDATVMGVDLSPELIAVARHRAAGQANVTVHEGDAIAIARDLAPIDLFISRHGVMFFADPVAAFADLHRAAAPDARMLFTCFRDRADNPWASDLVEQVTGVCPATPAGYTPGPFGFADPAQTARILEAAGWTIEECARVDGPYTVGEGEDPVADAVAFFRRIGPLASILRDAADPSACTARLKTALARYHNGTTVALTASAWLWRIHA